MNYAFGGSDRVDRPLGKTIDLVRLKLTNMPIIYNYKCNSSNAPEHSN